MKNPPDRSQPKLIILARGIVITIALDVFAQAICMIAVAFNLILVFSVCPMDLVNPPKEFENPLGLNPESTAATF